MNRRQKSYVVALRPEEAARATAHPTNLYSHNFSRKSPLGSRRSSSLKVIYEARGSEQYKWEVLWMPWHHAQINLQDCFHHSFPHLLSVGS